MAERSYTRNLKQSFKTVNRGMYKTDMHRPCFIFYRKKQRLREGE